MSRRSVIEQLRGRGEGMTARLVVVTLLLAGGAACTPQTSPGSGPARAPHEAAPAVPAPAATRPALPRVLLIGDSISIGYTPVVRKLLEGRADVQRPNANCGDTRRGLQSIDQWLGEGHWDVIHFNWGLHDLCYRNPGNPNQGNRDKAHGTISVPLDRYEENLDRLVRRLKATGATLVWASTTVVPEGEAGRVRGDEVRYNEAAARVMRRHGVAVDDLYALTVNFPPALFAGPGNVHYTREGYQRIGTQVVHSIESLLKQPSRQ